MSKVQSQATNGVSFGKVYEVVAQDATDGSVVFDFEAAYSIVASILVTSAAGVNVALADAVITYPANGQVSIADGAVTFVITAGDIISVIAQRNM